MWQRTSLSNLRGNSWDPVWTLRWSFWMNLDEFSTNFVQIFWNIRNSRGNSWRTYREKEEPLAELLLELLEEDTSGGILCWTTERIPRGIPENLPSTISGRIPGGTLGKFSSEASVVPDRSSVGNFQWNLWNIWWNFWKTSRWNFKKNSLWNSYRYTQRNSMKITRWNSRNLRSTSSEMGKRNKKRKEENIADDEICWFFCTVGSFVIIRSVWIQLSWFFFNTISTNRVSMCTNVHVYWLKIDRVIAKTRSVEIDSI